MFSAPRARLAAAGLAAVIAVAAVPAASHATANNGKGASSTGHAALCAVFSGMANAESKGAQDALGKGDAAGYNAASSALNHTVHAATEAGCGPA